MFADQTSCVSLGSGNNLRGGGFYSTYAFAATVLSWALISGRRRDSKDPPPHQASCERTLPPARVQRRGSSVPARQSHFGGGGGISPIRFRASRMEGADVRLPRRQSTSGNSFRSLGTATFARGPRCPRDAATQARTESS